MPPRKSIAAKAAEPAVFNLDDFRAVGIADVDEREIDMGDGKVLHLTLEHLTTRQSKRIPMKGSLEAAYRAGAKYIKAWDLTATNMTNGEVADVPAPGSPEATEWVGEGNEWQFMELLDDAIGSQVMLWLTNPGGMQLATERGKSRSGKSESTDAPASENGTTKR